MSKVKIIYGDVAVGAKESFNAETDDKAYLSNLEQFKTNNAYKNYTNPCELYSTTLEGAALAIPSPITNEKMGWWSQQISDENGDFETPIVLTLQSTGLFSSSGTELTFDTFNNVFPTDITVSWYVGDRLLKSSDFSPDASIYFCESRVEGYDKVVIVFRALNMPYNRLKVQNIEHGRGIEFSGKELRSTKLIQEVDPISSQISINTLDFVLDSKKSDYNFQRRQPISVYFNEQLKATAFINKFKRKSANLWEIQGEDYIGLMDTVPFYGDVYINKNASDLLTEIFNIAKVPFEIDAYFNDIEITGYIPYTTCREAIMQVAFAIQAVIDTSNSDVVKVYNLSDTISQTITLDRIMQGQNFNEVGTITAVELMAHAYKKSQERLVAYEAETSGTGERIFVVFTEPLYDLSIEQGEILSYGTNYAIINAESGCVLEGYKYEHNKLIKRINNPLTLVSDIENIISIENATMISAHNVDNVLQKCYNYLVNSNTTNMKIIDKGATERKYGEAVYGSGKYGQTSQKSTNVGDFIEFETEYRGNIEGRITKQTFNLNGGIIVKDTVINER